MVKDGCPRLRGYSDSEVNYAQSGAIELMQINGNPDDFLDLTDRSRDMIIHLMQHPSDKAIFALLCNLQESGKKLDDLDLQPIVRFRAEAMLKACGTSLN